MVRHTRFAAILLGGALLSSPSGLATVTATALGLSLVAPQAQAQAFRFSSFAVEGNQRITDETIIAYTGITPGQGVTAGQVNDALQSLQNSGLFERVEIVPRGSTLVIQVVEFPTINRIVIEGNRRISDDDLSAVLQSQIRRVYSPAVAEQDAAAIAEAYRVSGRLTATVNPVIIRREDNRVDLVFEVTEGRVVETQRIAFVGNREYSDRRLRRVLESTQAGLFAVLIRSDTFIEDRIALDRQLLTDFYRDRGYIDFEILSVTSELSRQRDAYFVTFNMREGQSFRFGNLSVVSEIPTIDADEYAATMRIRDGVTYSPRLVDQTIQRMENLATQQGERFVRVEPRVSRNDADLTLDIEFVITRGPRVFVERIDIEGNATTLDRVIRRQFDTVEGDPFDPRAIRAAAERIRATGYFADVQVQGREGSSPEQVIVDVDVEEQPTGSLGFSLSYSTDSGAGLAINFSERNFLGRGQTLRFGISTVEGGRSFAFGFVEPNFLARDVSLGVNLFYEQTSGQDRAFDTEDYRFSTSFGFPASENGRFTLSYFLEREEIIFGINRFNSSPILVADEGSRITSAVGLRYAFDNRATGLDPNAGVFVEVNTAIAGLGGDAEYIKTQVAAIAERAIMREEVTLRASFEGGALETLGGGASNYNDRFFLNSRQMRGFDTFGLGPRDLNAPNRDALGGNYFAVARFEAAFPLGLPEEYGISGGVFYDIGTVWGLDNTAGFGGAPVDDSLYWRSAVGVSIFWDTALGPLRFNFSQPLQTQPYDRTRNFDFTVEARF